MGAQSKNSEQVNDVFSQSCPLQSSFWQVMLGDGAGEYDPIKRYCFSPRERRGGLSSTVTVTPSGRGMYGEGMTRDSLEQNLKHLSTEWMVQGSDSTCPMMMFVVQ